MAKIMRRGAIKLAALTLLLLVGVVPVVAGPGNHAPDLDDYPILKVPAGNKLSYHAYAEGVQIYRWTGTTWAFVAPEAVLYADDDDDDVVGTHYAGPTWESNNGGKVVASVLQRATPDLDAIPWLLLKTESAQGPGVFRKVTYIQRVNTVGGLAPVEPGEFVGEEVRVPYAADYYFYRSHP